MKNFLRWLGISLAVLLTGVLGGVFYLAWRASKRAGKSVIGSVTDVPEEAQLLASEAESRASEAVSASLKAARDRAATLKDRLPIIRTTGKEPAEQPPEEETAEGGHIPTEPAQAEEAAGAETSESEQV